MPRCAPEGLADYGPDPMLPNPYRVHRVVRELSDTFTLELTPAEGGRRDAHFQPGQFNMLYVFGVGEVPISISGDPTEPSVLVHTIRAVGPVTQAMKDLRRGDIVGVRGPFGTPWPVEEALGEDLVIVSGGVGLAPLRPAIYRALERRLEFGKVRILYGARTPDDILFRKQLEQWRGRFDLYVDVTVDRAIAGWAGKVGVVTKLIDRGGFDPYHSVAFVCGPEVMMRYSVKALNDQGVSNDRIYVAMERNMKCAIGFCGHCQFGGAFVCKDGPVFRYDKIAALAEVREV